MSYNIIINDGDVQVTKNETKKEVPASWGEYKIIRTYSAGVFAGYLEKRNGKEGIIRRARRIWSWEGAASLSELAVEGTTKPKECRFPCEVDTIEVTEIVEVLTCTERARKSIESVPVWSAKNV